MYDCKNEIRQLMIALNKLEGVYYQAAKRSGVKENILILLYALEDGGSYSQKQISDEWLIPRTTINTAVKECIRNGYIKLITEDGTKQKTIVLTKKGQIFTQEIMLDVSLAEQRAFANTLKDFSPSFVPAMMKFAEQLELEFCN